MSKISEIRSEEAETKGTASSRSWAWTDYDCSDERKQFWQDLETKYMVFGNESCPETGRMHLQGFVTMNRVYRFKAFKKLVGDQVHIAKAKASDAGNYCMKDGDYVLKDSRKQGRRTDLEEIVVMVNEGKSDKEIAKAYGRTWVNCKRGIQGYRATMESFDKPKRKPIPKVIWLWGATGVGKSHTAMMHTGNPDDVWVSNGDYTYFLGYCYQPVVLLDDLRDEQLTMAKLLRLTDKWPMTVKTFQSWHHWMPEVIYITSPCHPKEMYPRHKGKMDQLIRRCHEIREVTMEDRLNADVDME